MTNEESITLFGQLFGNRIELDDISVQLYDLLYKLRDIDRSISIGTNYSFSLRLVQLMSSIENACEDINNFIEFLNNVEEKEK